MARRQGCAQRKGKTARKGSSVSVSEGRVAFRYAEEVNGSARNIAGVLNEGGNVLGMMPHPERMSEAAHGGLDGKKLFDALASWPSS